MKGIMSVDNNDAYESNMYKMLIRESVRLTSVDFCPSSRRNLHVTIAISGWLSDETGEKGFWIPWKNLKISQEQYCLMYESQYLLELGRAMDYLLSFAVSMAAQEALKLTILSGWLG